VKWFNDSTRRWVAVLGWMALIFVVSAQSQLPGPKDLWLDLIVEKVGHAVEYGVLAVLWLRALVGDGVVSRREVVLAVSLALLYALSDEFHQSFVPGRSADWTDVLADGVGALLGVWWWVRRRGGAARVRQSESKA